MKSHKPLDPSKISKLGRQENHRIDALLHEIHDANHTYGKSDPEFIRRTSRASGVDASVDGFHRRYVPSPEDLKTLAKADEAAKIITDRYKVDPIFDAQGKVCWYRTQELEEKANMTAIDFQTLLKLAQVTLEIDPDKINGYRWYSDGEVACKKLNFFNDKGEARLGYPENGRFHSIIRKREGIVSNGGTFDHHRARLQGHAVSMVKRVSAPLRKMFGRA